MSTPAVPRLLYLALVRVPFVVDATIVLMLLTSAPRHVPPAIAALLMIAFIATLPLALCAIGYALFLRHHATPPWMWRQDLAVVCGTAQAAFVAAVLLSSTHVS